MNRLLAAAFALTAAFGMASAAWADRPGTPNQERAEVIGPHAVRVSWMDTANGRNFVTSPQVIFEVEGAPIDSRCGTGKVMGIDVNGYCSPDPSSGYLQPPSYDPDGRLHWNVGGLPAGRSHCFRIWSRNRGDDMRSDQPSAWACADIPGERSAGAGPPMAARQIVPMRAQIVWLAVDANGVRERKNDGFVMAITPGHDCPSPWRDIIHQNGGFPALPPEARSAAEPYWLCWSALLPGNDQVTPPQGIYPPNIHRP